MDGRFTKLLLPKSKGELVVEVNLTTLGLKSKVSEDLKPFVKIGTSPLYLSSLYEFTVIISPRSFVGIS